MICPNCSSSIPDDHDFCGKCGHRVQDTIATLSDRLTKTETQLASRSDGKEQKYLESETVANVATRVKFWTTIFLFLAGIPLSILALAFAVIFGKGAYDLNSIASNAKQSVNSVIEEAKANARQSVGSVLEDAKSVASGAQKTANDARTTSQQVSEEIKSTQRRVGELKTLVDSRVAEAQKLDARIKESEATVASLTAKVNSQTQQVAQLSQQMKTVESQKSITSVKNAYPAFFGEHVAGSTEGYIDPKAKAVGEIYVVLVLTQSPNSEKLDATKVGAVLQSLQDHHYRTFLDSVWLIGSTGTSSQGLGAAFDSGSCGLQGAGVKVPCILYFSEAMKAKAFELRTLVSQAQPVPEDKVRYVPPSGLSTLHQELLQKSGLVLCPHKQ